MRDDPDPERAESVGERVDARHYGDPEGERPAGVAPLCEGCGEREASVWVGGRDLCAECVDVDRLLARAGERLREAADAASEQGVPVAADAALEATMVAGLVETVVNHDGDESDD